MSIDLTTYSEGDFLNGGSRAVHERKILTMDGVREHTFDQSGETKIVVDFLEINQALTLNKTRLLKLIDLFGSDTDDWEGKRIQLHPEQVNFGGKPVNSVAIARPRSKKAREDVDVEFDDE